MVQAGSTIGVLDDEPEMRKALRRLLTSHGYSVEEYESASGFIESLDRCTLDCLLLDLHMPGINGFDVLGILQTRRIQTAVIVLTGCDEKAIEDRVRLLGATAFLRKPFDKYRLFSTIEMTIPRTFRND